MTTLPVQSVGIRDLPQTPIRLVATDLDGTLLRSDGSVSDRTRVLLASLPERGLTFVMVTARPPRDLRRIAAAIGVAAGVAICCNGAVMYDIAANTILDHYPLSAEVATRLVIALRETLPDVCFAIENGLRAGYERGYLRIRGREPQPEDYIADALALCGTPVSKLLAHHPTLSADELLAIGREVAGEDAVATHSGARLLEISAPGVDKSSALAALCSRLGIAPAGVVAFGDMPNDVPMLRWAGTGIAVANAHCDTLATADAVTASNDDDGLAIALETLFARQRGMLA